MNNIDIRSCGAILLILGVKVDTYGCGCRELDGKTYDQYPKIRLVESVFKKKVEYDPPSICQI